MNPERWEQVKNIFELALACAPEERASLLAERCGEDREVREEVESLLAGSVIPGTCVGAYEIVRELGAEE